MFSVYAEHTFAINKWYEIKWKCGVLKLNASVQENMNTNVLKVNASVQENINTKVLKINTSVQ